MNITIHKLDKELHMEAVNEEGGIIRMDGTRSVGGLEGGFSPMQLLLAAIGGCSSIDIMNILKKQKQNLEDLQVEIEGDRQPKENHTEFTTIHLNYIFTGNLDPKKVERAIDLSIGKYCSVSKALEKTSEITYSYTIQ